MKYLSSKDGSVRTNTERARDLIYTEKSSDMYEFRATFWNCKEKTKRIALTEEFVSSFSNK